ncbi:MAG: hypothetical protein CL878_02410 [Dehalococcoidia bacterium]|nr:hypothetical protein [Dehalococcoidia bacterium]
MDPACLEHCLTEEERRRFNEQGYLIVENALSGEEIQRLIPVVDRLYEAERARNDEGPTFQLNYLGFAGLDPAFYELVDWPRTFPKVWGLLGWNIYIYHSHCIVNPPLPSEIPQPSGSRWHQDSARLNIEMETHPRPRISLKVAYFLTDVSEPGRGNFTSVPGSHLQGTLDLRTPIEGEDDPPGTMQVCVKPGTAVFFDRRLWHLAPARPNRSPYTRKVLFYGYAYRWLRPRDELTVTDEVLTASTPIRRQLFGAAASNCSAPRILDRGISD